jgi:hypothetical protein
LDEFLLSPSMPCSPCQTPFTCIYAMSFRKITDGTWFSALHSTCFAAYRLHPENHLASFPYVYVLPALFALKGAPFIAPSSPPVPLFQTVCAASAPGYTFLVAIYLSS